MKVNQLIMFLIGLFLISDSFADVNIDDFSSGMMPRIQTGCNIQQNTVNANVPGGGRRVSLVVAPAYCNDQRYISSSLEKGQPLVVSNDYGIGSRMVLRYGINKEKQLAPMNLNLVENEKPNNLNVTFTGGITNPLNFNVVIYMKDTRARSQCGLSINSNAGNDFNVSLPLDKFVYPKELEAPDYKNVDYIDIIVQSEKTNFAIKSIKATSQPIPNSITVTGAKCLE